MTTINEAMQSLYEAAEGKYTERLFSGVRRKFVPTQTLINPAGVFELDPAMVPKEPLFIRDTFLDPID